MASLQKPRESDDYDEHVGEAAEDIVGDMILR